MHHVRKFYDCSTAHLPEATVKKMELGEWPSVSMESDYGFLVHVPEKSDGIAHLKERGMECPFYLVIIQFAQDAGCDYILFDRDVETVPYLQAFDW
jgi:hypothetical protein